MNSSGVLPRASEPSSPSLSVTSFFSSAARIAALSLSTTAGGVPFGANTPLKVMPCTSGRPASTMVGTSGTARRALRPQHRQRAEPAGLDVLARIGELHEADVDMAGDQVVDRRRVAAIVHLGPGDAGLELQQLGHEMIDAGAAGRRDGELAGILLGVVDQLGHGLDRQASASPAACWWRPRAC